MQVLRLPLSQVRVFLAADARFPSSSTGEPPGDVVWVLAQRNTMPLAPALETQLGLQVQSLTLFPLFATGESGSWLVDAGEYTHPPELWACTPDSAQIRARPFPWLEVIWDVWVPSGVTVVGRVQWRYTGSTPQYLRWGWAALLRTLREGTPFEPLQRKALFVLKGTTPVGHTLFYMTGGPEGISSPYPALILHHHLHPGEQRTFTWVWTLAQDEEEGITRARHWAAYPWEAQGARRQMMDAHMPRISTAQVRVDWSLTRGRQSAPRFLVRSSRAERPYLVLRRLPEDYRFSEQSSEEVPTYPELWYWVTQYGLPSVQSWVPPTIEALLSVRNRQGEVDGRPALWGPQGQYLAHPLAVDLVWRVYQVWQDRSFLERIFSTLWDLLQAWFHPHHDVDQDGWPEWEHPIQVGLPFLPEFSPWYAVTIAQDLRTVESPSLLAFLYRACEQVASMARILERDEVETAARRWQHRLREHWENLWTPQRALVRYRDRDSHHTPAGRRVWSGRGRGQWSSASPIVLDPPARLVVRVVPRARRPTQVTIYLQGKNARGHSVREEITSGGLRWSEGRGIYTTSTVFSTLERIEVEGLGSRDRILVEVADLTRKDISLLVPLWAGLLSKREAQTFVRRHLGMDKAFWRPGGWSLLPGQRVPESGKGVSLVWNVLLVEGLFQAGFPDLAAKALQAILEFHSRVLDQEGLFFGFYHGETGRGLSAPETMTGLPPMGTLLTLAGLQFLPRLRVRFLHPTAFSFPVTVQMWDTTIRRTPQGTEVRFPWGEVRQFPPDVQGVLSLRQGQLMEG